MMCPDFLIDVKSAFNMADWDLILINMQRRNVSMYLTNIVIDYFNN